MDKRMFTIPNLITCANLLCGCFAIVALLTGGDFKVAFWFVMAAALLDFLDGFAARMLGQYSAIGKELDSLADMVSFGVAPATVVFGIFHASGGNSAWGLLAFLLAVFSALRLAKFNIDDRQATEFIGLPTPACAIFFVSAGWLLSEATWSVHPWAALGTSFVFGLLLVSNIPMFSLKFKDFGFRNNALRYTFLILSLVSVILWKITALPFIIAAYIIISAVRGMVCAGTRAERTGTGVKQ